MPNQPGALRLLNPLNIRFSQPRIAPHFRDGHLLEETAAEVRSEPLQDDPAYQESPEAAAGRPPYDLVILPPFPAIRVISWMAKVRGSDGKAERDENGDQILGKRAWFALDNRRLWSLQKAAAKAWPRRCCTVVFCLEDVPGATVKELRKFRTTTEGKQIELGARIGETKTWSWVQDAPSGATFIEEDELEGLFAEDLWDALQWAPEAAAAASERDPEDFVPRHARKSDPAKEEQTHASQPARTSVPRQVAVANAGYAAVPQQSLVPTGPTFGGAYAPVAPLPTNGFGGGRRGIPAQCPEQGWEYIDPANKKQGPFSRSKMRLWHEHGFFYPDLLMRCCIEDAFVPFAVLFPQPMEPFLGIVMRYKLQ